ncbi:MAG: hypothetical protein SGPRY_001793 [Prymnesium sp.]
MLIDLDFDENFGNPPDYRCLVSGARDENLYVATEGSIPWEDPAVGDQTRAVAAAVYFEALLREAPFPDPQKLKGFPYLSSILAGEYLIGALTFVVENGLVEAEDGDEESVRDFRSFDELQQRVDLIVKNRPQEPALQVDDTSWDDLEAVAAGARWGWMDALTLDRLTSRERTLRVYGELSLALGPRALEQERGVAGTQFDVVAGSAGGGQLVPSIQDYYVGKGNAPIHVSFMALRMQDFWIEIRWPPPFDLSFDSHLEYAFDVVPRSRWARADRREWAALIQNKIVRAIAKLEALPTVLADFLGDATRLVLDMERLGDAQTGFFRRLLEVDEYLQRNFGGRLEEEVSARHTSAQMVATLLALISAINEGTSEKASWQGSDDVMESSSSITAPKLLKEPGQPRKEVMDLLAACFAVESVLPKAVLLGTPGTRQAVYTQASDFLVLVKDERSSMCLCLGRCMAYDDEEEEVPADLMAFQLDRAQFDLVVLKLKAEEVGTSYAHHSSQEAKAIFLLIDEYAAEVYRVAGESAKRAIIGANPTDQRLGAWIGASEPMLVRLEASFKELKAVRAMRISLPGVFAAPPQARMLALLGSSGGGKRTDERKGRAEPEVGAVGRRDAKKDRQTSKVVEKHQRGSARAVRRPVLQGGESKT